MYSSEQMAQRRLESRAEREGYAKSESASSSPAAASSAAVVTLLPLPLRVLGAICALLRDCSSESVERSKVWSRTMTTERMSGGQRRDDASE